MNLKKLISLYLNIGSIFLLVSAVIDSYLWFTIQYHVPSWAISLISLAIIFIFQILRKMIK